MHIYKIMSKVCGFDIYKNALINNRSSLAIEETYRNAGNFTKRPCILSTVSRFSNRLAIFHMQMSECMFAIFEHVVQRDSRINQWWS